jgi:hypothetical protein
MFSVAVIAFALWFKTPLIILDDFVDCPEFRDHLLMVAAALARIPCSNKLAHHMMYSHFLPFG